MIELIKVLAELPIENLVLILLIIYVLIVRERL